MNNTPLTLIGVTPSPKQDVQPAPTVSSIPVGLLIVLGAIVGVIGLMSHRESEGTDQLNGQLTLCVSQFETEEPTTQPSSKLLMPAKNYQVAWEDDSPAPHIKPQDAHAQVRELVDEGAVAFIGSKGSGKTSKLAWLMGEHIKLGHLVQAVNPFCPAALYKGIKVWGRGLNYADAAKGIRSFTKEAKSRIEKRGTDPTFDPFDEPHWHLALDELSNYGKRIGQVDETVMPDFWEICTQFLRQVNMSVSFAGHGDTQTLMGGEKALRGKSKTTKQDLIRIYCQRVLDTSVNGNYRCAGWAEKVWLEGDTERKERLDIPSWMTGPNKDCNFTDLLPNFALPSHSHETSIVPGEERDDPIDASVDDPKPQYLQAILTEAIKLTRQKGYASASDIQRAELTELAQLNFSQNAIRYCLEQLAQNGKLRPIREGDEMTFVATPSLEELPEELKVIAQYAQGRDWLTASKVKYGIRVFRDKDIGPETIRQYFQDIVLFGIGEVRGLAVNLEFRTTETTNDNAQNP